ncbi:MAG: riboflavin biosynthesis protein RibF [Henriciella sp.]|nr:riboflavin biosynthesis protein RibF [Henriciella sp.]MBO6694412.1 riboflavin biosynthesis protein RibF [Henriciella sp.]
MTVIAHFKDVPETARGFSVALGNFDGVHAGHRAVIEGAVAAGGSLGVATFEPPPRQFFRPDDPPFRIYRPARRNARLAELGAKAVFELPFNADMAAMTDEDFARQVLKDGIGASHVTVGFDFRFGRGRMGDAGRLASLGRALGFGVTVIEKIEALGTKASSTAIRESLIAGEPERAAEILGHDWVVDGVVEHGEKRGRTIGFPTANLHLGDLIHPRHGVYAVRARLAGEEHWRSGVANFGRTPTTGIRDPLLETFIFDFDGDIYGQQLEVALVRFLRPELKFDSIDAMVTRMHQDVKDAQAHLAG